MAGRRRGSRERSGEPVWPLAAVVARLGHREVGVIEDSAPLERLRVQVVSAARMADDDTVVLAQHARTELIVSAVVYEGAKTAAVAERGGVSRQWVNQSVARAVGVGTRHPDHRHLATVKQADLEIPRAFDLLPDAAQAVRFPQAWAEAARPLRDRLIVLVGARGVDTTDLAHLTWLERAMLDRIQAAGRET